MEVSNLILPSVFLGFFLLALELPLDFAKLRLGRLGSLPRFCFNPVCKVQCVYATGRNRQFNCSQVESSD